MKILFLLFLIFHIGVRSLCQTDDGLDSLKKYSYLIIGAKFQPRFLGETPNLLNLHPVGYGTGFFFKRNDSLLLISAAHIFYNIDVYRSIRLESDIDYLIIRYYDLK